MPIHWGQIVFRKGNSMRRFRMVFVVLALVVAAGLVACQSPEGDPQEASMPFEPRTMDAARSELYQMDEESIMNCMIDRGFEYKPLTPIEAGFVKMGPEHYELSTADFVEHYGWGYATILQKPQVRDPNGDPNAEHIEELAPGAQDAWFEAHEECFTLVEAAASGRIAQFETMRKLEAQVWERFEADERVLDEYDRWAQCIGTDGFEEFDYPEQVYAHIQEQITALWEASAGPLGPDPEAYEEVVAFEKAIAKASLACDFAPPVLNRNPVLAPIFGEISDDVADASQ